LDFVIWTFGAISVNANCFHLYHTDLTVTMNCQGLYTACTPQQTVIILFFMKQYVIDELRSADYQALKNYLDEHYGPAALKGIYWIPLAAKVLTAHQQAHRECQPHYVAIDLDPNRMACELLVRTQNRVRCDCIGYATEEQFSWLIALIDDIFNRLKIIT
jgi:hypothetical protein